MDTEGSTEAVKGFCAGTIGGMTGTLVGHPFDTIKVRLQTNPAYSGPIDCLAKISKNEGPLALFKGLTSPLVGGAAINAVLFGAYGKVCDEFRRISGTDKRRHLSTVDELGTIKIALGGAVGGFVSAFVTAPFDLVKTQLQIQTGSAGMPSFVAAPRRRSASSALRPPLAFASAPQSPSLAHSHAHSAPSSASSFRHHAPAPSPATPFPQPHAPVPQRPPLAGPLDFIAKNVRKNGVSGMFKGLAPTWCRDVPGMAIYFASYEWLKKALAPRGGSVDELPAVGQFMAGGLGGTVIWLFVYPFDVIKSKIQAESVLVDSAPKYAGVLDCARKTYAAGGLRPFYVGLGTTLVRAFPANSTIFFVYEAVKRALG